jgi:signal peptidase II
MWLSVLATVAFVVAADHVTKHLASVNFPDESSRSCLAGTVWLDCVENRGGVLSLGRDLPAWARMSIFAVCGCLLASLMIAAAVTLRVHRRPLLAVILIAAGAASNIAERVARGSVVDFVCVRVCESRVASFNVADVAIALGAVLLFASHRDIPDACPKSSESADKVAR